MNADRAKAAGSSTWYTARVGLLPAATLPVTVRVPCGFSTIWRGVVAVLGLTVVTWLAYVYAAVMGRQLTEAGWPAAPGVTKASTRFSLNQIGEMLPSGKPL